MIFDVVLVCINALIFMLGTSSGLCILVKSHHSCFKKVLYFYAMFEVLTCNSYGDIDQNRVKISIFMLGTESCMELRVKNQKMSNGKLMH